MGAAYNLTLGAKLLYIISSHSFTGDMTVTKENSQFTLHKIIIANSSLLYNQPGDIARKLRENFTILSPHEKEKCEKTQKQQYLDGQ